MHEYARACPDCQESRLYSARARSPSMLGPLSKMNWKMTVTLSQVPEKLANQFLEQLEKDMDTTSSDFPITIAAIARMVALTSDTNVALGRSASTGVEALQRLIHETQDYEIAIKAAEIAHKRIKDSRKLIPNHELRKVQIKVLVFISFPAMPFGYHTRGVNMICIQGPTTSFKVQLPLSLISGHLYYIVRNDVESPKVWTVGEMSACRAEG